MAMLLMSCTNEVSWPQAPHKFVVTKIETNETQTNGMSRYLVDMPSRDNSINSQVFWFADSTGKFKVGDVLKFQLAN